MNQLKVWDDGNGSKLYATGYITEMGGVPAIGIAAWDGQHWSAVGAGVPGTIVTLDELDDPRGRSLFVVGSISTAGGGSSPVVAQLVGCPNCYVDCDTDGAVTVNDFVCFINAYRRNDPLANCDADASVTPADFVCFQNRFVLGCPGWTGWPPKP